MHLYRLLSAQRTTVAAQPYLTCASTNLLLPYGSMSVVQTTHTYPLLLSFLYRLLAVGVATASQSQTIFRLSEVFHPPDVFRLPPPSSEGGGLPEDIIPFPYFLLLLPTRVR